MEFINHIEYSISRIIYSGNSRNKLCFETFYNFYNFYLNVKSVSPIIIFGNSRGYINV